MKRYVLIAAVLFFLAVSAAVFLSVLKRPTETDYRLAKGRSQLFTENYLAALQTLRDIPDLQKRGSETHSYLGAAYLKLHLYKAAISEFEEAIKARPRESDPWIGLASSYIELGDASKAADQAKRATEIEKRSVDAWIALGRAQWQQRNFDEAEKAALKARELDADNPAVSDLLLHIYFDGDQYDKFQAELDRNGKPSKASQNLTIQFFLAHGQFARAYEYKVRSEREGIERAILEAQLALKRDPSKTELIPALAKNLVKVGRYEDAINVLGDRASTQADLELGKAYWMTGRKDQAVQGLRTRVCRPACISSPQKWRWLLSLETTSIGKRRTIRNASSRIISSLPDSKIFCPRATIWFSRSSSDMREFTNLRSTLKQPRRLSRFWTMIRRTSTH